MRKICIGCIGYLLLFQQSFASERGNLIGIENDRLRKGDITIDDFPTMLRSLIDFGIGIAGTIAVIFVIIGAYKLLFGSLSQDKSQGKNTIIMALTGFVLASLAWFIIKFILENLTLN